MATDSGTPPVANQGSFDTAGATAAANTPNASIANKHVPDPNAKPGNTPAAGGEKPEDAAARAAAEAAAAAPTNVSLEIGDKKPDDVVVVPPVDTKDAKGVITYEKTNDPKLDIALAFIGKHGFGPDHPGVIAAGKGDFSILKAELAVLGDKAQGWEAVVALGESALTERNKGYEARRAADQKAVLDAVGGAEAWESVKTFAAAATADAPHEREAVNAALSQGGLVAKAMAVYLKGLHDQHSNHVEPANALEVNAAGGRAASTTAALSPREYTAAVAKLRSETRGGIDNLPAYAALKARRALWREPRK